MSELLVRVETPRWVAGMIIRDGIVREAAPVLRKSFLGKTWDETKDILLKRKSYQFFILEPPESC